MKPAVVLLGACALLPLLSGTAGAQCKTEIDNVAKLLASRDAGAGPTTGAGAAGSPHGMQRDAAGKQPQHPPTGRVGQATPGGAASPQDVQKQTRGGPTAAQQAQGARQPQAEKLAAMQDALAKAREHDRNGRDVECMSAIEEAKKLAE
jgi:hypothetical protein